CGLPLHARATAPRPPRRATLFGTPGIGKSRLARELLDSLAGESRIVVGRGTAYGGGVPSLPLADIVRDVGDLELLLAGDGHGDFAARLVAGGVGERHGGGT